jgi:hypothetical protein
MLLDLAMSEVVVNVSLTSMHLKHSRTGLIEVLVPGVDITTASSN